MPNNKSSYQILLDVAIGKATGSYSVLENLKTQFGNEIDSRRRYACIVTFGELIDCLHRRDVLTDEQHQQLLSASGGHASGMPQSESNAYADGVNQYQQQRLASVLHRKQAHANATDNDDDDDDELTKATKVRGPTPQSTAHDALDDAMLTRAQRKDIYRLIVREIGRKWKDLARELDFAHTQIAAIEMEFPRDLSSCVYKLLAQTEHEHDQANNQLKRLCEALQACGRADLVRKCKKIVTPQ